MSPSVKKALVTAAILPFALAACGEDPNANDNVSAHVYSTVEECLAGQNGTASLEQCRAAFESAQEQHKKEAPRFTSKEDCEADFGVGRCESSQSKEAAPSGTEQLSTPQNQTAVQQHHESSFFSPFFMGYMFSNMMNSGYSAAPVYRTRDNRVVTPSGHEYNQQSGKVGGSAFTKHGSPTVVPAGKRFHETARYQPSSIGKTPSNHSSSTSPHLGSPKSPPASKGFSAPSRAGGFRSGGGFSGGR